MNDLAEDARIRFDTPHADGHTRAQWRAVRLWSLRIPHLFALVAAVATVGRAQSPPAPPDSTASHAGVPASPTDTGVPLPLRSVRERAALRPGFRRDLATGTLVFRSALEREPVIVVDGVRRLGGPLGGSPLALLGAPEGPYAAVASVDALGSFVPASIGEAGGGVVLVETSAGGPVAGGRVEGLSSEATDAYGSSVLGATVHGPLGRAGRVSVTGEVRRQRDVLPSAGTSVRPTDGARARLDASPQVLLVTDASGATVWVPFPTVAARAAFDAGQPFGVSEIQATLPPGTTLVDAGLVNATETLSVDDFERSRTQDDPLSDLSLTGQAEIGLGGAFRLRAGGTLLRRTATATAATPAEAYRRRLFNADALSRHTLRGATGFATLTGRLTETVTLSVQGAAESTGSTLHPLAFSDDVADALQYGDVDDDVYADAQRVFVFRDGVYVPRYQTDGAAAPRQIPVTGFSETGAPATFYDRQHAASVQFGGRVSALLGRHRLEVGAEAERQSFRRFQLQGYGLAAYAADGSVEVPLDGFPGGVARYDQLPFSELRPVVSTYGYTYNGTATTDTESVDGYVPDPLTGQRSRTDVAPFQPVTLAVYARHRFEAGPAALDIGLRISRYDARATTLFDPYATRPILRAESLDARPAGIGGDFAVYVDPGDETVGFRDRDGRFYDAAGAPVDAQEVLLRGSVRAVDAPLSEAFATTDAALRLEPRVSVRVRASDRLTLTGHAMRLSRRPDPALYVPFSVYEDVAGATVVPGNAALRPETVDAAGLGVEGVASPTLTLSAEAYRRQRRSVARVKQFEGGAPSYIGVDDDGAVDETGLDLGAQWSPVPALTVGATYALASARVTGSSRDLLLPLPGDATRRADGDMRHAVDLVVDLRLPDTAGPILGGVGVGIVVAAQSGLPYTPLEPNTGFSVFDPFTSDAGELDSARLPWTSQVDLRVQRRFEVGPASITAFAWAENVLGTRNVLAVYRSTGEPDDDGFLPTLQGRMLTPAQQLLYAAYISGPATVGGRQSTGAPLFYGRPRQVRLGVVLEL